MPLVRFFPAEFYRILAEVFKLLFALILLLLDFQRAYGKVLWLPVTLLVWTYAGAMLLLFGASLSTRGVILLPGLRIPLRNVHSVESERSFLNSKCGHISVLVPMP